MEPDEVIGGVQKGEQIATRKMEHLARSVLDGGRVMRRHQRLQTGQIGHQLRRTRQRGFALPLHIAKGLHRVRQVAAQAVPNVVGHGVLHDQQGDGSQPRRGQQHGDEKLGP